MKDKVSRRDFLKAALLGIGAGFITACEWFVKPFVNISPSVTITPSNTSTIESISPDTPTSTPTETPTPTEIPCFHLLTPENGAKLPVVGKITFSWEAMQGAVRYQLQFTLPSGQVVSFDVESISNTRYIESFLAGGIYTWQVIALDSSSAIVCISEPFTFEKPAYASPQNNGGDGGDTSGGGPSTSGSGGPGTGGTDGSNGQ
jgi:hypothetical protein